MLDYRSTGIQKFIFDRLCQIDEEIVDPIPNTKSWENAWMNCYDIWFEQVIRWEELSYSQSLMDGILRDGYWIVMVGRGMEKIKV